MQTYEIYWITGFCDSEWERLGEIQTEKAEDVLLQVIQRWPNHLHDLLVAQTLDSVLPLALVKKEVGDML